MDTKYYALDPSSDFGLLKDDFFNSFNIRRKDFDYNRNQSDKQIQLNKDFSGNDLDLSSDNNSDISNNNFVNINDTSSSSGSSNYRSKNAFRYPIAFKVEVSKYLISHTTKEASKRFGITAKCAARWKNFHEKNTISQDHELNSFQGRRHSVSVENNDPIDVMVDLNENSIGVAEDILVDVIR